MKLNINSKELLALYDLLYERYAASESGGKYYKDDDLRGADDTQLRQLYGRLKSIIIASLTAKVVDTDELFDRWEREQREKISKIGGSGDLHLRADDRVLLNEVKSEPIEVLSADDVEDVAAYPRKAPKPLGPRPGKYAGNKR